MEKGPGAMPGPFWFWGAADLGDELRFLVALRGLEVRLDERLVAVCPVFRQGALRGVVQVEADEAFQDRAGLAAAAAAGSGL